MTTKKTSFGPVVITCRGAGSKGHDPQTIGAGKDVGLDVQIPVTQTANAIQVSQPDGTVIWSVGAPAVIAAGAVPVTGGNYVITAASAQALTLAAPTTNGTTITITSATAFAHTLTATGLLQTGSAAVNVATFAAFAGASLTLVAYNGKWQVRSSTGITFT
jgi:hypothetical protein